MEETANMTNCYAFEVQRLRESLDRLLLAAVAVRKATHEDAHVTFIEEEEAASSVTRPIELLRSMVLNGLPRDPASLTLVDGIGSKWAKRLVAAGIASIEALAFASKSRLQKLERAFGRTRCEVDRGCEAASQHVAAPD